MPEWAIIIVFIAAYFAIMGWILPAMGVPT
jgi:hypothetical protein